MADNWLLDLQLATAVFKADQAAIWLAELGLPRKFEAVVREHIEFYRAKARVEALKRRCDAVGHPDPMSAIRRCWPSAPAPKARWTR